MSIGLGAWPAWIHSSFRSEGDKSGLLDATDDGICRVCPVGYEGLMPTLRLCLDVRNRESKGKKKLKVIFKIEVQEELFLI